MDELPGKDVVDNFLAHYGSQYYDPVKAHEYYMKTRQLKGLPTSGASPKLTKEQRKAQTATNAKQREAMAYATNQIRGSRQTEVKSNRAFNQQRRQELHKKTNDAKAQIEQKLKDFLAKLDAAPSAVSQVNLNEIPKDAPPEVKAFLESQNRKMLNQAKSKDASTKRANAKLAQTERSKAVSQKRVLAKSLSNALAKARQDYATARNQTSLKYKTISETEKKNIQSQVH